MRVCPKCGTQYPDDANFCPTDAGRLVAAPEAVSAAAPVASSPGIQVESLSLEELYELGERLGGGYTGEVLQATERKTGQVCAIKRVDPAVFMPANLALLQRTERELKQLERVDSSGIARVLGHGKDGDSLWIASELVPECRSALELVDDDGPMEISRASRIVLAVGQALSDAARLGVIHRDLAPKNVLVLPDDRVKVINFSIPVPTTPKVHGVPEFVSPEQVEGKPADQRSNIYSLGAVFYYLVTGRPPFMGEASELYVQHASGTPEPPSLHVPVSEVVDGVILRALERSASKRYMTLRQFLGVIEPLASGNFEVAAATAPAGKGSKAKGKLTDTLLGGYAVAKVVQEAQSQAVQDEDEEAEDTPVQAPAAATPVATAPVVAAAEADRPVHASNDRHEAKTLGMGAVQVPQVYGERPAASDTTPAPPRAPEGAANSPEARKRTAENKAKFRETLWFKKGELDAAAAAAAEADARRGRHAVDKADLLPVEDRYADDGSLTAGDREKFSLKTGGTETLPAIRDRAAASDVTEQELASELQSGRGKILAAIAAGIVLLGAVVAYAIHTYGSHGPEKAPETKPVIEQEGAPAAPAPPPQ